MSSTPGTTRQPRPGGYPAWEESAGFGTGWTDRKPRRSEQAVGPERKGGLSGKRRLETLVVRQPTTT